MDDAVEKEKAIKMAEIYYRRFGRQPTDEEKSVALTAWFEAELKFDPKKKVKLETFAEKVIIRRLITFYCRCSAHGKRHRKRKRSRC